MIDALSIASVRSIVLHVDPEVINLLVSECSRGIKMANRSFSLVGANYPRANAPLCASITYIFALRE
jgi:hypothetical protein